MTDAIAEQSVQNAVLVATRLEKAFARLAAMPGIGHRRPELNDPACRVHSVSGYLVIHDAELVPIHILRVVRGARSLARLRLWS